MFCDACGHRFPRGGALVLRQTRRVGMTNVDEPPLIRCPNCKDGPVRFDIPGPDMTFRIKLDD